MPARWRRAAGALAWLAITCRVAVDTEHHLIVAHEVINVGHDRTQLAPMGRKAQAATGCEEITALADRGYFNGEQVLACEGTGVLPCIPKTVTSASKRASSPARTSSTMLSTIITPAPLEKR